MEGLITCVKELRLLIGELVGLCKAIKAREGQQWITAMSRYIGKVERTLVGVRTCWRHYWCQLCQNNSVGPLLLC